MFSRRVAITMRYQNNIANIFFFSEHVLHRLGSALDSLDSDRQDLVPFF